MAFVAGFAILNLVLFMPGLSGLFGVEYMNTFYLMVIYGCSLVNLFTIQFIRFLEEKIGKKR